MTKRKDAPGAAPEIELVQPPHGGSFTREADGSLTLVESAIAPDEPAEPEAAPTPDNPAPDVAPPAQE